MNNTEESLVQRLKGRTPPPGLVLKSNTLLGNCQWYFGHEVQIATFYSNTSYKWSVLVYHAGMTIGSSSQGGISNDVHLYASSTATLFQALDVMKWQVYDLMDKLFTMEQEGGAIPTIKESPARCACQHVPTIAVAGDSNKIQALEARLQALKDRLGDGNTDLESTGTDQEKSLQDAPQLIESKQATNEPRLQDRSAETTTVAPVPESTSTGRGADVYVVDTGQSGDPTRSRGRSSVPPAIPDAWKRRTVHQQEPTTPSPCPHDSVRCDNITSDTARTPSVGNITPTTGPDDAQHITRANLRQEVNDALATAMIGMAGILRGRGDGGM